MIICVFTNSRTKIVARITWKSVTNPNVPKEIFERSVSVARTLIKIYRLAIESYLITSLTKITGAIFV